MMEPSFGQTWFFCPNVWTNVARRSIGRIPRSIAFSSYKGRWNCKYNLRVMATKGMTFLESENPISDMTPTPWRTEIVSSDEVPQTDVKIWTCPHLIVKACTKIMWNNKKVVSSISFIPEGPLVWNKLDCTSHHPWRLEWQWKSSRSKITSSVNWHVEPISLFWVECSHRTREQETMHEHLSGKHVIEASWILGDNPLVVLAWQVIDENLQPSNRIVF